MEWWSHSFIGPNILVQKRIGSHWEKSIHVLFNLVPNQKLSSTVPHRASRGLIFLSPALLVAAVWGVICYGMPHTSSGCRRQVHYMTVWIFWRAVHQRTLFFFICVCVILYVIYFVCVCMCVLRYKCGSICIHGADMEVKPWLSVLLLFVETGSLVHHCACHAS